MRWCVEFVNVKVGGDGFFAGYVNVELQGNGSLAYEAENLLLREHDHAGCGGEVFPAAFGVVPCGDAGDMGLLTVEGGDGAPGDGVCGEEGCVVHASGSCSGAYSGCIGIMWQLGRRPLRMRCSLSGRFCRRFLAAQRG